MLLSFATRCYIEIHKNERWKCLCLHFFKLVTYGIHSIKLWYSLSYAVYKKKRWKTYESLKNVSWIPYYHREEFIRHRKKFLRPRQKIRRVIFIRNSFIFSPLVFSSIFIRLNCETAVKACLFIYSVMLTYESYSFEWKTS